MNKRFRPDRSVKLPFLKKTTYRHAVRLYKFCSFARLNRNKDLWTPCKLWNTSRVVHDGMGISVDGREIIENVKPLQKQPFLLHVQRTKVFSRCQTYIHRHVCEMYELKSPTTMDANSAIWAGARGVHTRCPTTLWTQEFRIRTCLSEHRDNALASITN